MKRRGLLKLMAGVGAAVLCPLCAGGTAGAAGVHWAYTGEAGADRWGNLDPGYSACSIGSEQSPIDLRDGIAADLAPLQIAYKEMPLRIVNNGHTIQINVDKGSLFRLEGEVYELLQYHFHTPSEHLLAGRPLEMELHLVHKNTNGNLAVLCVFMAVGRENPVIGKLWKAAPAEEGPERKGEGGINPAELLPADLRRFYRYAGSLTTPPCSEIVTWTVLKTPIEVSAEQVAQFAKLFPMNARPALALNRRFLLESR